MIWADRNRRSPSIRERLYGRAIVDLDGPCPVDDAPCWNFTRAQMGGSPAHRYGSIWYQGWQQLAHRVSYQLAYGVEFPKGRAGWNEFQVDHVCGNTTCINPAHLELVTSQENTRRMFERNTQPYHCPGCRCEREAS